MTWFVLLGVSMVSCTGPSDVLNSLFSLSVILLFALSLPFLQPYSLLASLHLSSLVSGYDSVSWRAPAYKRPEEWMNLAHITFFFSPLILSLSLSFACSLSFFPSSPPFTFSPQMQTIHRKQEIMASVQSARANQRASWEKPRMRGEKQPIVWRRLKSRKDGIVWRGDKSSCCHSNLN